MSERLKDSTETEDDDSNGHRATIGMYKVLCMKEATPSDLSLNTTLSKVQLDASPSHETGLLWVSGTQPAVNFS